MFGPLKEAIGRKIFRADEEAKRFYTTMSGGATTNSF
jgi:hypothetical protein